MEEHLRCCLDKYKETLSSTKFAVAVSGGSDSLGLLLIANKWSKLNNSEIIALTVDHGLRKESPSETKYVNKICNDYGIEHKILVWEGDKPKSNIELEARENRYRLMSEYCRYNSIKYLLVAHHLEDQAETFFIRLFRGSGIDGLSSMNNITFIHNLNIIRPFLKVHKNDIKKYLIEKNIKWLEDSSNQDEKFLRNKIRNFLGSFDNTEKIIDRINFAIDGIGKTKNIINKQIERTKNKIVNFDPFGSCLFDRKKLLKEDEEIILKILAQISMEIGGKIYKPRLEKLKRLFEHIKSTNNIKYTFYGCIFEQYNDNMIIVYREYNSIGENVKLIFNREVIWDNRFKIILKKDLADVTIGHVKEGKFNKVIEKLKKTDIKKYREMKEIKGIEKKIFYTLPFVVFNGEYILDCNFVEVSKI